VPFVLNVIGPRGSKSGGIQKRAKRFLIEVLTGLGMFKENAQGAEVGKNL